jgi:hypothetical protein
MGYQVSEAFPSKYLRAADLHGRTAKVVIDRVEMESVVQNEPAKLVLYFKGKEKGVVLNKTNALNLSSVWGDDTDSWIGGPVELFSMKVQFQSNLVDAIRMRAIGGNKQQLQRQAAPQVRTAQASQAQAPFRDELDDDLGHIDQNNGDIPF